MKLSLSRFSYLLLFFTTAFPSLAQVQETSIPWKGFEKITFKFNERDAWYIKPKQPATGNPWIWRAHFPDWHTDMDSILVSRGFHVAYINTNNMFASPEAMMIWDNFYQYLTTNKKLAPKVALEGVSRGGLYVYGWAKRNPSKVSIIYAEAPVCDPKSWPGGKGTGIGSAEDWEKWKTIMKLTEEDHSAFTDFPLHNLEGLAAYKVPVIHVIGLNDKVVPNAENTYPLIEKYTKLGGPAMIYPMTRGEQKLNGHHFPIENPQLFADLIQQHSMPVKRLISSHDYLEAGEGIKRSFELFEKQKKGTVAYLGGSITHNPGWRNHVSNYLQEKFPLTTFEFIAAGIPSLGSTPHAFRFQQDVLDKGIPDLLFIESAVNDRTNGFSKKAQVRALEGIIAQAKRANPAMNIVVMAFADPDKNEDYFNSVQPLEVEVHRKVAKESGAAFINLAQEVYDRIQAKEFSWEYDFKDLHPSPYGQEVYFNSIKALLNTSTKSNDVRNSVTPSDQYAYSGGRYLNINSAFKLKNFKIDPTWKPQPPFPTRQGFVNVPLLIGEVPGATMELEFNGRAIGIAVVSGPDAGKIAYRIDNQKEQIIDLYSKWSGQLHLPWYLMLEDELKSGKHKLHIRVLDEKNPASKGNACRIVYFLENQ